MIESKQGLEDSRGPFLARALWSFNRAVFILLLLLILLLILFLILLLLLLFLSSVVGSPARGREKD